MRFPKLLILCAVTVAAFACVGRPAPVGADDADPKLTLTSYVEDGTLVALIASSKLSRIRHTRDYMPVEFAVANKGVEGLTLTRESFSLIDEDGTSYPAVGLEELAKGYGNTDIDRRLTELPPVVGGKFNSYGRVASTLTPSFDRPMAQTLRLPRFTYAVDVLYFPKPNTGVRGHRFELFLSAPELDDPIFVKFAVND